MKIKSVLAAFLCLLLVASVSHAAATATIEATASVSSVWVDLGGVSGSVSQTSTAVGTPSGDIVTYTYEAEQTWTPRIWSAPSTGFTGQLVIDNLDLVAPAAGDYAIGSAQMSLLLAGSELYSYSLDFDTRTMGDDPVLTAGPSDYVYVDSWGMGDVTLKLSVTSTAYTKIVPVDPDPDPDPNPNPIPAPGAVLLSSLGAGLVGWMRRRKTL